MRKVLGIVAEYNPFHNGHLYHLNKSKEALGCSHTVAIISGNFVQRGLPSLIDKWAKTQLALENGIDLVLELPTVYAISSSENFAYGSIGILNSLGIVDYISFGSECGNLEHLSKLANIFSTESSEYKAFLNNALKNGISFPKAQQEAVLSLTSSKELSSVLSSPNNTLAIEYLKALNLLNSSITPFTLNRQACDYNSCVGVNGFASATAIREYLLKGDFNSIKNFVSDNTYTLLNNELKKENIVLGLESFENEILYSLRKLDLDALRNIPDISEGLEYAIKEASNTSNTLSELIFKIKSKRYTRARIQRILLYILLDITKSDIAYSKDINTAYIRVLGANEKGKELLSEISAKASLPIVTSVKKYLDSSNNAMLEKDILSSNIYALKQKNAYLANRDFTNRILL